MKETISKVKRPPSEREKIIASEAIDKYFKFSCSVMSDPVTPWAIGYQAPLFTGFSRQEYWSGLPFPSPEDLPDPGIEPKSLGSPALASRFLTTVPPGNECRLLSKPSAEFLSISNT